MKLALLGNVNAGKSIYLLSLYFAFRDVTSSPVLTPTQRKIYQDKGILNRVGLRLEINDDSQEKNFRADSSLLARRPIDKWPPSTDLVTRIKLSVQFDFVPVDGGRNSCHKREFEVFDPAGGAFTKLHEKSPDILHKIKTCDTGMVFCPAVAFTDEDNLLDALDDGNADQDNIERILRNKFAIGAVLDALKTINKQLASSELLPVCFLITMFDEIPDEKKEQVFNFIYDRIVVPFSIDNDRLLICVCPVSVKDRKTGDFRPFNIEWPFMFSAAASILRNGKALEWQAATQRILADSKKEMANRLQSSEWWEQIGHFLFNWETWHDISKEAVSHHSSAKRCEIMANDEIALAAKVISSIAHEQGDRRIAVLAGGKSFNLQNHWK